MATITAKHVEDIWFEKAVLKLFCNTVPGLLDHKFVSKLTDDSMWMTHILTEIHW